MHWVRLLLTCVYRLFLWAPFRHTKATVKMHTLLDLRCKIPTSIHISDGKLRDVNALDLLVPEPGAFYTQPGDKKTGLICDQTVVLTGAHTPHYYPEKSRRIKHHDATTDHTFMFLTNNFTLPALTIAELYRCSWQIELFFKRIKQYLRIKAFFGTSENAMKSQIWIAISTHILVAILKKRMNIDASLYTLLQVLSLTLFECTKINQLVTDQDSDPADILQHNKLTLFD